MKLNEEEMRMVYQIESTNQSAALNEIYMTWRYTRSQATKDTAESLLVLWIFPGFFCECARRVITLVIENAQQRAVWNAESLRHYSLRLGLPRMIKSNGIFALLRNRIVLLQFI